jgi:bifunctional DNase/RNase
VKAYAGAEVVEPSAIEPTPTEPTPTEPSPISGGPVNQPCEGKPSRRNVVGMYEPLVELAISEVRAAVPMRLGQEAGLAVLAEREEPFRSLQIYIGQAEARAIQAAQRGEIPPRPATWDLFLSAVTLLGARLDRAVIDRVEEARHFYASVTLVRADESFSLACRPSDAIALVAREPASLLYATEDVMVAAGRYPGDDLVSP